MQNVGRDPIVVPIDKLTKSRTKTVLALGGELKANYCFIKDGKAYLFTEFSDLKNPLVYQEFKASVLKQLKNFSLKPDIIAHDSNPVFLSTRFALELKGKIFEKSKIINIQHHYAHIAAALAENNRKPEKVIGVACDGTGWGDDGNVWGCEFMRCDLEKNFRFGHLDYMYLPGSEQAIKEPWRIAFGMLFKIYKEKVFSLPIPWLKKHKYETKIMAQMIRKQINTPFASSAGRLFDAVSALIGVCLKIESEAQAALLLEEEAKKLGNWPNNPYAYVIKQKKNTFVIDVDMMISAIVEDLKKGREKALIAARFHETFSDMIVSMCKKARGEFAVNNVVLSGGVFFNSIVSDLVEKGLQKEGFLVCKPSNYLLGDSGLALGQAVISYVSRNSGKN